MADLSQWVHGTLDNCMLPLLKVLSPGYHRRFPSYQSAGHWHPECLSSVSTPSHVQIQDEVDWRGWRSQQYRFKIQVSGCHTEEAMAGGRLILANPHAPWTVIVPGLATGAIRSHGFGIFQFRQARALLEQGINVALMRLPMHMDRAMPGHTSGEGFFSPDLHRTQLSIAQGAAEALATVRWLMQDFNRPTALWGTSLGGCISGLAATCEPNLAALVLMEPLDNPGDPLAVLAGSDDIRRIALEAGIVPQQLPEELRSVAPSTYQPAISTDRILFVTPMWDRVVPSQFQEAFWTAWGRPERLTIPAGHLTLGGNRHVAQTVSEFVARHLGVVEYQ